jgi:two-component system cell cycle sensor histidine kinase/response regulator CckA
MWGLLGVVLLFDLYTIYQQLQIHRIRRRLFEREELFRLISDNAADMIAVVDMDGNRIYNSQSYSRVLGYDTNELKKSSAFEQIHEEDRERVRAAAHEARLTGVGKTLEYRIRHKDGTWRILESTSSVIRSPKGEPQKLVIVNRDITERKETAESLRQSESGFRSMVEHAPYGIFRCRTDGKLLSANPALQRMLGYESAEELLQRNLVEEVLGGVFDSGRLKVLLEQGGEFKDITVELKRRDGAQITVRCSGGGSKDQSGSPAFDVFAEDVTEKRVLERQLQMATKMEAIGRLSGGIAHDFNNLLGVIIGYSQLFKRKLDPQNPLLEHALEIEKAGQRAAALTKQLLAFSRQQILSPAILDLNDLVMDMIKMLPRLIGEDIAVHTLLKPDLCRVKADRGQIEQVIMNLAVNARDAMPTGGRLTIETANVTLDQTYVRTHPGSRLGQYIMLEVRDSGTGIAPEALAHIFEPFFTTKEVGKGTGLGLATVYGIVKQSEGYIWVDSEPGKGASFQVFLPKVDEEIPKQKLTERPSVAESRAETILLVEDSDALRKLTKSLLEANGYHVLVAENGEQAQHVASRHPWPIQLLVTDVVMPGINGRKLAERLLNKQPSMKVLFISGYTDNFVAIDGVLEQGMALLNKPFTEEELVARVRDVLGQGTKELMQSSSSTGHGPAR